MNQADKLESLLRAVVDGWRNDQLSPHEAPELYAACNAADDYLSRIDIDRATAEYEARNAGVREDKNG